MQRRKILPQLRNRLVTESRPEQLLRLPNWICKLPEVEESWNAELQTLEGHSYLVRSVVFFSNGQLLASSSEDKTRFLLVYRTSVFTLIETLPPTLSTLPTL